MTTYQAQYFRQPGGGWLPEVIYPPIPREGMGGQANEWSRYWRFTLADESEVTVLPHSLSTREAREMDPQVLKIHLDRGITGQWGDIKRRFRLPEDGELKEEEPTPFRVEMVKEIWKFDPRKIVQDVEDLLSQISGRNRQIKSLREQLAAAKQR